VIEKLIDCSSRLLRLNDANLRGIEGWIKKIPYVRPGTDFESKSFHNASYSL